MTKNLIRQDFILDGVSVTINSSYMEFKHYLIDVTSTEDRFRNHISSGVRTVHIEGFTDDRVALSGIYLITGEKNNILEIQTISKKKGAVA